MSAWRARQPTSETQIEVKEQEGVPPLDEPLPPVQLALLRLCEWVEQFPQRDEDIQVTVSNQSGFPFAVEFILSPKHGLLLDQRAWRFAGLGRFPAFAGDSAALRLGFRQ